LGCRTQFLTQFIEDFGEIIWNQPPNLDVNTYLKRKVTKSYLFGLLFTYF